jgi:hypothetical protein
MSAAMLLMPVGMFVSQTEVAHTPAATSAPAKSAPGSTAASSTDASNQAQKAITAINNAASAISKANDAVTKAGTYEKAIQDITGSTAKSTQSVTDNRRL